MTTAFSSQLSGKYYLKTFFDIPLTEQEKRLVSILEVVEVKRHIFRRSANQWLGRKKLDSEAVARSYVAKELYRHSTTRNLIRALQSSLLLRRICGFEALCDIPSESTFSWAFKKFPESALGHRVHDVLVHDYLSGELIGHISRDSTAIVGREKPVRKTKESRKPRKKGRPAKGEKREPTETRISRQTR
jgi:transposase